MCVAELTVSESRVGHPERKPILADEAPETISPLTSHSL